MTANGGAMAWTRSRNFFGPAMRACSICAPGVAVIAVPLRVAPWPATAKKNSSLTGA